MVGQLVDISTDIREKLRGKGVLFRGISLAVSDRV
jgi:hypothetical protein